MKFLSIVRIFRLRLLLKSAFSLNLCLFFLFTENEKVPRWLSWRLRMFQLNTFEWKLIKESVEFPLPSSIYIFYCHRCFGRALMATVRVNWTRFCAQIIVSVSWFSCCLCCATARVAEGVRGRGDKLLWTAGGSPRGAAGGWSRPLTEFYR